MRRFARRLCSSGSEAGTVTIAEDRLREFLAAEAVVLAKHQPTPISLQQVLAASTPRKCAEMAHQELPIRYAHRLQQIEGLPKWRRSDDLCKVHELYFQSLRDMRLADPTNIDVFIDTIAKIKRRFQPTLSLLMEAMRDLKEQGCLADGEIDDWLDQFLLARIGTEMLTSQFIALAGRGGAWSNSLGIVQKQCNPADICTRAASRLRILCAEHYRQRSFVNVQVDEVTRNSEGGQPIRFPYVPQYLFYIILELLKNSARATVESARQDQALIEARPIKITVSADPREVAIRIQDSAGGIPHQVAGRIWSYMYSTAGSKSDDFEHRGTPLAGYGVGLPLCRLYANFLGGSLRLVPMHGQGTYAYLHVRRLDAESCEDGRGFVRDPSLSGPRVVGGGWTRERW